MKATIYYSIVDDEANGFSVEVEHHMPKGGEVRFLGIEGKVDIHCNVHPSMIDSELPLRVALDLAAMILNGEQK